MINSNQEKIESITEAALFPPQWLKEPYSWVGHIPFASWLVQCFRPRVYIELGTHTGNSYFSVCQATKEYQAGTRCYAVDTWQGDAHAKNYGEEVFDMVQKHNADNYADFSKLLRMTFDEALAQFDDGSVDLLHIDGLHTYEAVKHDFESWFPKLAPGAIVMFHDTNVFKEDFGVWKYWAELKEQYPDSLEFKHSFGLGILQISKPDAVNSPLKSNDIKFFNSIGQTYEENWLIGEIPKYLSINVPWQTDALLIQRYQLMQQIAGMENSLSWKLTAPLRWFDGMLRKK
jgi:hypothetical protein